MARILGWLLVAFLAIGQAAPTAALAAPDEEQAQAPRGLLGIFLYEDDEAPGGAKIESVKEGTPAAKAGLKAGDVIVSFNGAKVASSAALAKKLGTLRANENVRMEVEREGWRREFTLTAAPRPEDAKPAAQKPFLGVELAAREGKLAVEDVRPGSPAAQAGIKKGDEILEADGRKIGGFDAFGKVMEPKKPGDELRLLVARDGWTREFKVKLGARADEQPAQSSRPARRDRDERRDERPATAEKKEPAAPKKPGFLGIYCKDGENGLIVESTIAGSPAERAGLQNGDVIVNLEGRPVRDLARFTEILQERGAGDRIAIVVRRNGASKTIEATLGERPQTITATPATPAKPEPAPKPAFVGISVEPADAGGFRIVRVLPGSPAEKAGLKEGQLIKKIDGKALADLDAFAAHLKTRKAGDEVTFALAENGQERNVKVVLGARED